MDMRKTFDTVHHIALMRALRSRGLPDTYASLLSIFIANHTASVNRSSEFQIPKNVKQGDPLNVMLLNCVLDTAFNDWRLSFQY